MKSIVFIFLFLLIAGCANPINQKTASNYYYSAIIAQENNDWKTAKEHFGRAIINSELGGVETKTLAVLWYEYGRSSGVVCDWDEAEKSLLKAYELDGIVNGPTYMSLYELALMNYDRKNFVSASNYFKRAHTEFEQKQIDTKDPVGYADFLEMYADTLEKNGDSNEMNELKSRALKIRAAFNNKESHTDRTPYGTQCEKS